MKSTSSKISRLLVNGTSINNNTASDKGAGVYVDDLNAIFEYSEVTGNEVRTNFNLW